MSINVLALILGGGQGSRLFPLTKVRAKPAVPIGGKFRLIDIPISNCLHWGINKIFILTQFNSESLHRHIVQTYKFDSFSKGFVRILAAQQTVENTSWYQGTADAVRKNLATIKNEKVDHIVILSGDQLFRINLTDFVRYHLEKKAEITIASKPIPRAAASSFGIIKIDENRRIVGFSEKPKSETVLNQLFNPNEFIGEQDDLNFLASMGIYIFNKETLIDLLESSDNEDFGKEIIPNSIPELKVFSYIFRGYWEDIGTIKAFFESNLDFANVVPKFNFYDEDYPIYTRARFLPCSKVRGCQMNNALISDGSIIEGSQISDSVVGLRSVIRQGAQLDRVVMMGADYYENDQSDILPKIGIGRNCIIRNAILDLNVRIGDGSVIDYQRESNGLQDNGAYYIIDGIVVIPKDTTLPANTVIK